MVPVTQYTHLCRELPGEEPSSLFNTCWLSTLRHPWQPTSGNADGRSCQNDLSSWPTSSDRQPERHPALSGLQLNRENHCQTTVVQQCTSEKGTQNFRQLNPVFLLTYMMDPMCSAFKLLGASPTSMTLNTLHSSVFLCQPINQYFFKYTRIEPSF